MVSKKNQSLFESDEDSLLPNKNTYIFENVEEDDENNTIEPTTLSNDYNVDIQNYTMPSGGYENPKPHETDTNNTKTTKPNASPFLVFFYIVWWYTLSICLSVYNKWFFGKKNYNFPFSLFTTFVHTIVQFLCSFVTIQFFPKYKTNKKITIKNFIKSVLPCGSASGLDVGLSNTSLKNVTLTFYTMVKSSTPVFVLLFAFLFHLEKPSTKLIGIILIIVIGVFIMVMEETEFNIIGFIEIVTATVLSGLRWSLTQILLQKESLGLTNPIITNYYLSPVMGLTVLIFSMVHEGLFSIFSSEFFGSFISSFKTLGFMSFGGLMAFSMIIAEYNIIMTTGVVTLSVAGIFKEIIVLVCSHFIFHDIFTTQAIIGLFISIIGIALYNYHKISIAKKKEYIAYEHTILCDGDIDFFVLDDEDGEKLYEMRSKNQMTTTAATATTSTTTASTTTTTKTTLKSTETLRNVEEEEEKEEEKVKEGEGKKEEEVIKGGEIQKNSPGSHENTLMMMMMNPRSQAAAKATATTSSEATTYSSKELLFSSDGQETMTDDEEKDLERK